MNKCPKCEMILKTNSNVCPLCHNKIDLKQKNSIYPELKTYSNYNLLIRLSLFITICGIIFSLLINYWVNKEISWSVFVILGILSFWLTFSTGINRKHNFMRILFTEILSIHYLGFTNWFSQVVTHVCPTSFMYCIHHYFLNYPDIYKTNTKRIYFIYLSKLFNWFNSPLFYYW